MFWIYLPVCLFWKVLQELICNNVYKKSLFQMWKVFKLIYKIFTWPGNINITSNKRCEPIITKDDWDLREKKTNMNPTKTIYYQLSVTKHYNNHANTESKHLYNHKLHWDYSICSFLLWSTTEQQHAIKKKKNENTQNYSWAKIQNTCWSWIDW